MKKYALTLLLVFTAGTVIHAQIPDPQHDRYNYKDSTFAKNAHQHQTKLQPKLYFGLGEYSFDGDVSDSRDNGLMGRTGMHFGLTANLNDFFDATISLSEGIIRVDGIDSEESPENFMSTLNTVGISFNYNFKNIFTTSKLTPFISFGLDYLKFDSRGSNDNTTAEYELDLSKEWLLQNGDRYSTNSIAIPLGLGINFELTDRMNVHIANKLHLTNTDYIDNVVSSGNDSYSVTSAAFVYDLFCYDCDEYYQPEVRDDYLADVNFKILDETDSDYDGVSDIDDFCPKTPKDVKVTSNGCPVDMDLDGVPDYKDQEPNTPKGTIVNVNGVQVTDTMGEELYLSYLNAASRGDADTYLNTTYPKEEFMKITKEVINKKGDTLEIDIFKPIIFQEIEQQEKHNITHAKPGVHIDLKSQKVYKIQIAMYDKGMEAATINKLLSIGNLKSTIEGKVTIYTAGDFKDVLEARLHQQELMNKGYFNAFVLEDNRGELRAVSEDEMNREENIRSSVASAALPPVENIIFRVELGVFEDIDEDFFDIDDLVWFKANDGYYHVFSGEFPTYQKAADHRNEGYMIGYENAKIIAIKDGEFVNAEEYLQKEMDESQPTVFGDVIFKVQLGILSSNASEEERALYESIEYEATTIGNGLTRFTIGEFTGLAQAQNMLVDAQSEGFKNAYIIAFFNGAQISLKKAQELIEF